MKMCSSLTLGVMCIFIMIHSVTTQPADCTLLQTVIPGCNCESAINSPNDIVINCRNKFLTSVPTIKGTYAGLIYEFTLAHNDIMELPGDAFQGLKILRLDVTGNKLRNISIVAFRGLETNLTVLKLSGDIYSPHSAPFTAISNLFNLQELFLQNFQAPSNNLEDGSYFQPFSNLLKLTLDNWGLESIGTDAFRGLTSLKELTLSKHVSLVTFPVGAMNRLASTIEKITITQTGISTLYFYGFSTLHMLQSLVLSSNNINDLEEECFYGLENKLTYLDLSFNNIPEIKLGRIQVLKSLQYLLLQNIGLASLSQNSVFLSNKTNLKELDLSENLLTSIPNNTFKDLTKLTKLELSQNEIAAMAVDSLNGLTSLESLHLDSQRLSRTSLTLPALAPLTSLTYLLLDHTPLSVESWDSISQAQSLTRLRMRHTGVNAIPRLAFQMMTNLAELDLSDNQIEVINQRTFVGPRDTLIIIYLSNNKIGRFDSCTFYSYSPSLKLDLVQNPLQCDCSLRWLSEAVKAGQLSFLTTFETCTYPSYFNGTRFTSLDPSVFCTSSPAPPQCNDYYTTTTTIPTTTTTLPNVIIIVVVTGTTADSVTVTWTSYLPQYLSYITVAHTELPFGQVIESRHLDCLSNSPLKSCEYTVTNLKSNTRYQICVEGHRVDDKPANVQCIISLTKSTSSASGSSIVG